MAKVEYNIPELLALASFINYQPELATAVNSLLRANTEVEYQVALENANTIANAHRELGGDLNSQFGLPVFMPLVLESYQDGVEDMLLESAVVEPTRSKNIVETEVQGRDETVKEFINNGGWSISVSGILCNPRIGYPIDLVEQFSDYMAHKQSLSVVHELLNLLDVHEVVITSYKLPKTPFINCQPYEFTCSSDKPLALRIEE